MRSCRLSSRDLTSLVDIVMVELSCPSPMTIVPVSGGAESWPVEAVRTQTARRLVFNLPLMPTQGGVAFLLRLSTKQPSSGGHHEYVDEKLPVK
ncbi:hypothetical protein AVEN_273058-1 [Araneus ventricosus]|uniref:Uncharacterized protein n=1 Tax=Araneus ventricosus TaxID=182803 RepID=A0A4Y2WC91_ARAVE|nr:hypothetical protein AVEN_273058-1 [Araneus ventricosus]